MIVGFVMEAGAILFSAELAMHLFTGVAHFFFRRSVGGTTMLLAWIALAVAFATANRRPA